MDNNVTVSDVRNIIGMSQSFLLLRFYDMGHVAACAKTSCILPGIVKTLHTRRKDVTASEKYDRDKETFSKNFANNVKTSKRLHRYAENRRILYELIKEVYPDFCSNMESKVGNSEFALYKKAKADFKKVINTSITSDPDVFLADQLQSYQDRLTSVIDSKDFSRACNIEDHFIYSELDNFLKIYNSLPENERKKIKHTTFSVENNNISALAFIKKIQDDRISRIERQNNINSLYGKLDDKPYINSSESNPEER